MKITSRDDVAARGLFGGQGGDKHFGISEGKGGGVKILMPLVVGYGCFLESPIDISILVNF